MNTTGPEDRMMGAERAIARVLSWGVLASLVLIAGGTLLNLAGRDGRAVVTAGLLVLIATPVIRVAISIWAFLTAPDRTYVAITSVVLILLLASFLLGKTG